MRGRARSTASPRGSTGGWSGIAHYLFHPQTGAAKAATSRTCSPPRRRAAKASRPRWSTRWPKRPARAAPRGYYWLTKEDNRAARALYDRIARLKGFLRYDYPL